MNDLMRIATLLVAVSISTALAPTRAWARTAPVDSKVTTAMEALPDHAAQIRRAAQEEVRRQLEGADVSKPADIEVHVDFLPGESIGWYAYDVSARYDGKELTPEVVRGKCETCKPKELVAKIGLAVAAQRAAILDANASMGASEPVPAPTPVVTGDPGSQPTGPDAARPRWTALGKAGVGVASVGVAAVVTGVVLVTQTGSFTAGGGNVQTEERRNGRPPGIAIATVGGAALIAGLAMVIADRVKAKREGKAKGTGKGTANMIAPAAGARGFALVVGGRF